MRRLFWALLFVVSLLASAGGGAQTLPEALITAYSHHPRLLAERMRLQEVDESYIQARSQGRLQVDVNASYGISASSVRSDVFTGDMALSSTTYPATAQVQIIQPIYQGGRVAALKRQSWSQIRAARMVLRQMEQDIFMAAAMAYNDVVRDMAQRHIRRNNVQLLTRQLQAIEQRFELGVASRTDIAQAQSRLAGAEIGLSKSEAQLQMSRISFARHIGASPVELFAMPVFARPDSLKQALEIAFDNNPDLLAAHLREQASQASIATAKSYARPRLNLNGSLQTARGQSSFIQGTDTASVTAQLSMPLLTGGIVSSQVRAAKAAQARQRYETADIKRQVRAAVHRSWAGLIAAQHNLGASERQLEAALIAFNGVELEYELGRRTILDVLDAEQELLQARLNVTGQKHNIHNLEFQLLVAMGTFDAQSLELDVRLHDPQISFEAIKRRGPF